jgi:60S ribosome subunit biogenesis protein NIP7
VYYLPTPLMKQSISVARPNLISLGTCFGRFSKSGKFKLAVTSLDFLATYAKFKVWIKPNGELPFLYGNHVVKAHLGRITEDTPEHQGVVVFSMSDVPLGFGVTARSTMDTRKLDPTSIIVFHQAYVRSSISLSFSGAPFVLPLRREWAELSRCDGEQSCSSWPLSKDDRQPTETDFLSAHVIRLSHSDVGEYLRDEVRPSPSPHCLSNLD